MNRVRSSFALITFCATATLLASLGLAVVFTSASVAVAFARGNAPGDERAVAPPTFVQSVSAQAPPDAANERTFSGLITDDRCGARHAPSSGKSPSECVNMCIRNGSHYELVNGDRNYLLEGNADDLGKLASQRANVVGSLNGDSIKVSAVAAAQ